MRNKRKILIEQLEEKLKQYQQAETVQVPPTGWIHAIRTTLNMSMAQLGQKLNITRQGVKSIEKSEAKGTITLNSLRDAGDALDFKLVYGFVPKDKTMDTLIHKKAKILAEKIVMRTHQNMSLENQGIEEKKIKESIQELAQDIKREMRKSLWD